MNDEPIEERFRQATAITCGMMRYELTMRQQQVTWMYITGVSAPVICTRLGISDGTFRNHLRRIMAKVDPNDYWPRSPIILMRLLLGLPGITLPTERNAA